MAGKPDTKWLEKRRQSWYAVLYVPPELRPALGQKLRKSLGTRDLLAAQKARHAVLGEFRQQIERAEAEARDAAKRPPSSPFEARAEGWRETLAIARQGGDVVLGLPDDADQEAFARDVMADEAAEIEHRHGPGAASPLGMTYRGETPILEHVPTWFREGGQKGAYEARTKAGHERNLTALKAWLAKEGLPVTVEAVTRRQAGRYVSNSLMTGREAKTVASIVSSLRSYWTFMARKGLVGEDSKNPWDGAAPPKGSQKGTADETERPFTDAELCRLLAGPADQELADLMRVAALSGMRIEECYRLETRDCADGWFHIRKAKTKAGQRRVPIHPELAEIVARRCKGKASKAYLFDEAGPVKEGRERSMAVSKRFGNYRKRPGMDVDEAAEGKRRSLVNFHSFRRWFITAAARAGQPERVLQQVVGHKAQGMTMGTYFGGDMGKTLRACVEAVKLPPGAF